MRTHRKTRLALAAFTFLGMTFAFGPVNTVRAADEAPSSSECIKCHTDLDRMDSYGAASAGGAAAIAG